MIYDENWNEVENPDLEAGYVTQHEIAYVAQWVIDSPAIYERQIVAEYPNGGKDVKTVEISPEVGHWEAVSETGLSLPFDIEAPSHADKTKPHHLVAFCEIYKPYTSEELEARALEAAEKQAKAQRDAENEALLLGLGEWQTQRIEEIEKLKRAQLETNNTSKEQATDIQNQERRLSAAEEITKHFDDNVASTETVQSVLLALGEVGEMAASSSGQEELMEAVMLAVAELGEMVAALMPETDTATPETEEETWQTSITD